MYISSIRTYVRIGVKAETPVYAPPMGELVLVDFGHASAVLTKKQFARHPDVRRSTRWVEQRVNEGMPSHMDGYRRMFPLDECLAWLARRRDETGA